MFIRQKKSYAHKIFKSLATKGKTSPYWFVGFKVHLIVNDSGAIWYVFVHLFFKIIFYKLVIIFYKKRYFDIYAWILLYKFYTKELAMKKHFAFLPLIASCNGLSQTNNMNPEQSQCPGTSQSSTESDTKLSCSLELEEKSAESLIKSYYTIISALPFKNQLNALSDIMSYISKNNKLPIFNLGEKELKKLKDGSLIDMVTKQQPMSNKFKKLFLSHLKKLAVTKLLDYFEKMHTDSVYEPQRNDYYNKYYAHFNELRKLCLQYLDEIGQENLCELLRKINQSTDRDLCQPIEIVPIFESENIFEGMLAFFQESHIELSYRDYAAIDALHRTLLDSTCTRDDIKYVKLLMKYSSIFDSKDLQRVKHDICFTDNDDVLELMLNVWPCAEYMSVLTKSGKVDIVLNMLPRNTKLEQELAINSYTPRSDNFTDHHPYKINYLLTDVLNRYDNAIRILKNLMDRNDVLMKNELLTELDSLDNMLRILVNKEVNITGIKDTGRNSLLDELSGLFDNKLSWLKSTEQKGSNSAIPKDNNDNIDIIKDRMNTIIKILSGHKDFPRLLDKKSEKMTMRVWINEKFPSKTVSFINDQFPPEEVSLIAQF